MFRKTVKQIVSHKISRTEIANQTEELVQNLCSGKSIEHKKFYINELNKHLSLFPASRIVAVKVKFLHEMFILFLNFLFI